MTLHADEEADEDDLSILDIESAILSGTVTERQKDRESGEWKYVIHGRALDDREVSVVTKLATTGKAYILTVYEE